MEIKGVMDFFKITPENTVFWTRVFSGILLGYNGFRYVLPKVTQKISVMKQHRDHVKANPIFKEPWAETLFNASVKPDYDLAQIDFDAIEKIIAEGSGFVVKKDNKLGYLNAKGKEVTEDAEHVAANLILQKRYKNYYGKEDIFIPRKEKR